MITRKHYSEEFKRKLGLELAAGMTPVEFRMAQKIDHKSVN